MYLQIEEEFKQQSEYRNNQILIFLVSIIFFVGLYYACNPLYGKIYYNNSIEFLDILYPVLTIFLFFATCYVYIFIRVKKCFSLHLKDFFNISQILNKHQEFMHKEDIKVLQDILKNHSINTRPKLQEAIRHYQCLLPRKVISNGQLLAILAFAASIIALWFSEPFLHSDSSLDIILFILTVVAIFYLIIRFVATSILKIFSNDALYTRLEASLSEIFMTYYLKKEDKSGEENNG